MNKIIILTFIIPLVLAAGLPAADQQVNITNRLSSIPFAFTENQGQWDARVLFRSDAAGATMWFTSDGAHYQFSRRIPADNTTDNSPPATRHYEGREPDACETMAIKATFVGANPHPTVVGEDILDYKCNYFLGNDPARWKTDVPNYNTIVYQDIYPGIDLRYYGNGRQMEYDFILSPGADLTRIRIRYEGVESVSVSPAGELVVRTMWGEVTESRPVVYQLDNGSRVALEGGYVLLDNNSFGFALDSQYDPTLPLVIDPALSYSTYLGGSDYDIAHDIDLDDSGDAWVIGTTSSADFPTINPYQTDQGFDDVFVTKFDYYGSSLIFSTYIGGENGDIAMAIAVGPLGDGYITGYTYSDDFPTVNAYQSHSWSPTDVFVAKLTAAGNSLDFSTYLGGSGDEFGDCIDVDMFGCAYVCGGTGSDNFPTRDPYQTYQGGGDGFLTKFTDDGTDLMYSTFLGGSGFDYAEAVAVHDSGWAYVTGTTSSPDFPVRYNVQTHQGGLDVFFTKFDDGGQGLFYSTYLGGTLDEYGEDIVIDGVGAAYVAGYTSSSNFPTINPFQTDQPGEDCIVFKMNDATHSPDYSTYLGGSGWDHALGISLGVGGTAYITGATNSVDYPLVSPAQPTIGGGYDAIVSRIGEYGNELHFSTYLGGSETDCGWRIAVLGYGLMHVAGYTNSADFPLVEPFQTDQGGTDGFVAYIDPFCCVLRGDVDHDGGVDPLDAVYLVNYMWRGGPAPP